MKQESVDSSKIDIFIEFHGLAPQQKPLKEKPQNIPSKEDLMKDHVLVKYVKMTKVGVPIPAVCSKMTQDNVDLEKMDLFNLAFGLVKTNSPKRSPIPRVPRGRRRASTALQKIHWSAVADESKLKNSVWACQAADPELDETDIQKLVSSVPRTAWMKCDLIFVDVVAGITVCCGSNQQSCYCRKESSYCNEGHEKDHINRSEAS
jgi:hypothetical protein